MAKIIAVTNQKGGVGKTTTCVNLSSCMAALGKRILVVDIDPQGNCTSGFGLKAQDDRSTYEALLDPDSAADCIMKTCVDNLEIMPSGMQLAGAEIELIGMDGRESRLKRALRQFDDRFDYIMIDSPPSLGILTLNGLTAADSVIVPIQCEYYALEGVGQLMNTLNLVRARLNPELAVKALCLSCLTAVRIWVCRLSARSRSILRARSIRRLYRAMCAWAKRPVTDCRYTYTMRAARAQSHTTLWRMR